MEGTETGAEVTLDAVGADAGLDAAAAEACLDAAGAGGWNAGGA